MRQQKALLAESHGKSASSTNKSLLDREIRNENIFDNVVRAIGGAANRREALKIAISGLSGLALSPFGIRTAWAAGTCLCNGEIYDPTTACCLAGAVLQKNPIANLSACPNKVADPTHVCMPNGCGTEAHPLPNGFGAANFRPCCNTHDCCYDKCNGSQAPCDNDLLACFKTACATAYPPVSGIPGILQKIKYGSCISAAETGYSLVFSVGSVAFNAAQKQACDCCGDSTCPQSCAGGACGALPACAGGADCVCFTSVEGNGACIHGDTPCSSVQSCSSTADCPTGTVCVATSCCGSFGVCGPLCSDVTPPTPVVPRSLSPSKSGKPPTLGGF